MTERPYIEDKSFEKNKFSFDPEANYIRGAKFARPSVAGLLNKYDIEIL